MSWKKHFRPVSSVLPQQSKTHSFTSSANKFSSWLPEVYQGPPDRLQRYAQYEQMAMDHEVSSALDTIAEFCTQKDYSTKTPFKINFKSAPSTSEHAVISNALAQWVSLNEFDRRMFKIFRSTLMYGDQFFIRDPKTYKLYWVDPNFVKSVIVNESAGKRIETYYIRDLDLNHQSLVASSMANSHKGGFASNSNAFPQGRLANMMTPAQGFSSSYYTTGSNDGTSTPVASENVIHVSMSDGTDSAWPFGISELEPVYKIFKQKSMLEDAMLIYRIHRAPERRMFFIDVGDMPPTQAQQYLERVKYEVQQKRIPNKTGGGANVTDSIYNPLSTLEDYYFAIGADGRGSKVEVLPGGEALGEISDMLYFNNKMFRALGIPSSYLPSGPEDGSASVKDGKVGTSFIQEYRFTERCKRHQRQIIPPLDREFKLFMKHRGITVDNSAFELEFTSPQNFSEYRQIELDTARVTIFNNISQIGYISKQYALKRYLGWTEADVFENEKLWKMENPTSNNAGGDSAGGEGGGVGMGQVGIPGGDFDGGFGSEGIDLEGGEGGEDASGGEADLGGGEISDEEISDFVP